MRRESKNMNTINVSSDDEPINSRSIATKLISLGMDKYIIPISMLLVIYDGLDDFLRDYLHTTVKRTIDSVVSGLIAVKPDNREKRLHLLLTTLPIYQLKANFRSNDGSEEWKPLEEPWFAFKARSESIDCRLFISVDVNASQTISTQLLDVWLKRLIAPSRLMSV